MHFPSRAAFTRRSFLRRTALGAGALYCGRGLAAETPAQVPPAVLAPLAPTVRTKIASFNHYEDAVLVAGEPPAISPGSFTIVALPDTQRYAEVNPQGFLAQTEWIAANAVTRNIACALHLGDITDNNEPAQWELAVRAMKQLDGQVPYFMAMGNHDYSAGGVCSDRTTLFNDYFPLANYGGLPTFGGVYDKEPERLENSFHVLSAGGRDLLVLCLEFGPRRDVVRWANEIVARHPRHAAILVTHAYVYFDDRRFDWAAYRGEQSWNPHSYKVANSTGDDISDGEELWQTLVSKHPNFIMTVNGHVLEDGLGRLTSAAGTREVHQMLFNCQMRPNGGDGWMRLLEFKQGGIVEVWDFSPLRQERNESAQNKFTLRLAPVA